MQTTTQVMIAGKPFDFDAVRNLMDDSLCDQIHGTVDTDQEFVDALLAAACGQIRRGLFGQLRATRPDAAPAPADGRKDYEQGDHHDAEENDSGSSKSWRQVPY